MDYNCKKGDIRLVIIRKNFTVMRVVKRIKPDYPKRDAGLFLSGSVQVQVKQAFLWAGLLGDDFALSKGLD